VDGIRFIEQMLAHPVDKDALARELEPMRALFTKSVVARTDLPAGTVLTDGHLALKKPGTGLPPSALSSLPGRRLTRAVAADEPIRPSDLD
jgi:N-acetylneuraminate synthase